jgi:hypothetical protein
MRASWPWIAVLAIVFGGVPLWIVLGGAPTGAAPGPVPANPAAVVEEGEPEVFSPGELDIGDGVLCESHGLRVGAWVPKPRHETRAQAAGPTSTASIRIRTLVNGFVIVRCG